MMPTLRTSILRPARRTAALTMQLWQEDAGQDLVEYGIVIGLIGLSAIYSFSNLGLRVRTAFNTIGSNLTSAT